MPAKQKPKTRKTRKSPMVILKDQIKELNSNIDDQNEKYLRLKAEFDNYRKRKDLEIIDILKYDGESIIKEFLSIIDDLYRSREAFSDNDKLDVDKMLEGIDLIISKINKKFEELGVTTFTEEGDIVSFGTKNSIVSFPERIFISTAFLKFEVLNQ